MARVGQGTCGRVAKPAHHRQVSGGYRHIRPQPVDRQPLQRAVGHGFGQVQKQILPGVDHKEIRQILALRGQQRRPDHARPVGQRQHVVADQPLQKGQRIVSRQPNHPPHHALSP